MLIEPLWMLVMFAGGTLWIRKDVMAYERFTRTGETKDRQRAYARWTAQSFLILTGASVVSLWLAGGLSPFDTFPAAFDPAHALLQPPSGTVTRDAFIGMAVGVSIGLLVLGAIQWHRLKKTLSPHSGPAEALIARNRREAVLVLGLSLNAGFSEELFFRLALPLLVTQLTGSLLFAFVFSTLCFGLAHAYQGWKGVLGTMLVGGLLAVIYLKTGSLLQVMLLHAMIDIVALLVRPFIARIVMVRARARASASAP